MAAKLVALALPLGLDTFAVAAALGALGVAGQNRLRLSLLFAAFEAGMPLIGLALGAPLGRAIGDAADYIAIGFTLGLLRLPAALVVVVIAVQAFIVTQLGLRLGDRLSERLREGAERVAGLALIVLAVVLLAEKLTS